MPKLTKHPRLRSHVKKGKHGQVWTSWWYDMRGTGQPDVPLGNDYATALARWAELRAGASRIAGTVEEAIQRYEKDILPGLHKETARGYVKSLRRLRPVFGPAAWDQVTLPTLVAYLEKRTAKTQGNRELSLLSVIWNRARMWGMTDRPWPAAGLEKSRWKAKENTRAIDFSDDAYAALYRHADQTLRDAMDIASATGLRIRDVLGLRLSDVRAGKLVVTAGKTGKRAEFDTIGSCIEDIAKRRRESKALHIYLLDAHGRVVTERMLHDRFVAARQAAAKDVPECGSLMLRDMRKRAAQLSADLASASALLQHSSQSVTRRHYAPVTKLKPVR